MARVHQNFAFGLYLLLTATMSLVAQSDIKPLAPPPASQLILKVMVIDRDLNVKPVPKFTFIIRSIDPATSLEILVTTGLEGIAKAALPAGEYEVTSASPLEFENKRFTWDLHATLSSPETTLELSNDNATIVQTHNHANVDDLTTVFKEYRDSIVTVWAEVGAGHGTGFIADSNGLVITNQHVVTTSQYIAVQFDQDRMLPATLLASDATKDVAILWVDFSRVPEAKAAPLISKGDLPAEEGERVFTIGSPLHQSKVMTTGIVSKVEARAIISDININHGNSGGPLFNSHGRVIGITTFGDTTRQGGPGISGIVRIEQALPLLEQAKGQMTPAKKPSATFLPSFPADTYPIEAIKANMAIEKFKVDPYVFGVGDYDVAFVTPILRYRHLQSEVKAEKAKEKRNRKSTHAVQGTFQPLDDLRGWFEYVGEYEPVLLIQASPKLKETFWSGFSRGMAASHGYIPGPAKLHFKTDFYKMRLLCGQKEVPPLFPGKVERVLDERNSFVSVTDATFDGLYKYPANAITPQCGTVTLQLFSEKDPDHAREKTLDQKTVGAVISDFAPYLALHENH